MAPAADDRVPVLLAVASRELCGVLEEIASLGVTLIEVSPIAVPAPAVVSEAPSFAIDITPADRAALEQLATGVTDERAAANLCVSVRTLRRRVAHGMVTLGARSRFQAGVIARAAAIV